MALTLHRSAALLTLLAANVSLASGYAEMVEDLNPISYWRLGEAAGVDAVDAMGVSDGEYLNGITLGEDSEIDGDTAVEFNGRNSHVVIPHDDAYLLDAGTISMWFKAHDARNRQELFSKDSTNFDTGGHLTIMLKHKHVEVRIQNTTTSFWLNSSDAKFKEWNHLLVTWGPNGLQLYVNGELEDTDPYTGGLGNTSGGAGNFEPIVLGANAWQSNDLSATPVKDYFKGQLDEVFILGYQPNESQIANMASPTGDAGDRTIRVVQWRTTAPVDHN